MGADGTLDTLQNYDPYGNPMPGIAGSFKPTQGYTGEPTDASGLVYLRARDYNPAYGAFLSRDPVDGALGRIGSYNGYSYVEGNPIRYSDPSGKCVEPVTFFLCAIIGGIVIGGVTGVSYDVFADQGMGLGGQNQGQYSKIDWQRATRVGAVGGVIGGVAAPSILAICTNIGGIYSAANIAGQTGNMFILSQALHAAIWNIGGTMVLDSLFSHGLQEYVHTGGVRVGELIENESYNPLLSAMFVGDMAVGAYETGLDTYEHYKAMGGWRGIKSLFAGKCSFDADTEVTLADGTRKPISQLKVGDKVLAYNEKTGKTDAYAITATHEHTDPVIVTLTIDGEQIDTTPEHPFFTQDRGWVAAGLLKVGDHIRKADGKYGQVEAIQVVQRSEEMYNLTVDEAHTFFVGKSAWLVHNECSPKLSDIRQLRDLGLNRQQRRLYFESGIADSNGGIRDPFSGLGKLQRSESLQIQSMVDSIGEPLYVVGSMVRPGMRKSTSDIDYAADYSDGGGSAWDKYQFAPLPQPSTTNKDHPPFPLGSGFQPLQESDGYILFRPNQFPFWRKPD